MDGRYSGPIGWAPVALAVTNPYRLSAPVVHPSALADGTMATRVVLVLTPLVATLAD